MDKAAGGKGEMEAARRELELLAAGVKAWGTWNTTRTLQTCRECCGGEGYMSVNRLPALKADADIFTTFEGDNTVLMLWMGRQLLADADRAGGGPPEPPAAEWARVMAAAASVRPAEGAEKLLREYTDRWEQPAEAAGRPESLLALFWRRATGTVEEIRQFLQVLGGQGVQGHEAMAGQQNALLQAAHARVELVMLERFEVVVAEQGAEEGVGEVLRKLCELFALALVEQHRGWYLERRLIPAGMSMALGLHVDRLCAELAPEAEGLVEAFGIPAPCLAAPIAGV